ncbi:thiamine-phosphate kinase [Niveibacterium terrae]|uniref:thiamine-phosphate kinase n=1 Tax=Niveibacterium terrae TaxID=3373598 RepID=UPI003A939F1B
MPSEFALIARHFVRPTDHSELGIGDDAALIRARPGMELAISTDMLVSGTHFLPGTDAHLLGWKTAAVNLSDIAAMGGEPRWITLALALPEADEAWVAALADGFFECCQHFGVDWIGGDTTRGPLNLCATVFGEIPQGLAIRRSGAVAGDDLWISGTPGLAVLGLEALFGHLELAPEWQRTCLAALERPQPRIALGRALRGHAHAMLDVSDGLAGDLGHILESSGVGGTLDQAALPLAGPLAACGDAALALEKVLYGGDDYELIFAAPPAERAFLMQLAAELALPLHRIGVCETSPGLRLAMSDASLRPLRPKGFDHFA